MTEEKVPENKTIKLLKHTNVLLWGLGGLIVGGAIGFSSAGVLNNPVLATGSDGGNTFSIKHSDLSTHVLNEDHSVAFDTVKASALQRFYPQEAFKDGEAGKSYVNKEADKLIDTAVKVNGGKKSLSQSLESQGSSYKKWHKMVLKQAKTQVKADASAEQAIDVIKDANVVKDSEISKETKNFRSYRTNAYLAKDKQNANKIATALKDGKTVDKSLYVNHQDGLVVSSVDSADNAAEVLNNLKGSKKNDVKVVTMKTSDDGVYVFNIKNTDSYKTYKQAKNTKGMQRIRKDVKRSLIRQAALDTKTVNKAIAKVMDKHDVHFKSDSLNSEFYDSLKTSSSISTISE